MNSKKPINHIDEIKIVAQAGTLALEKKYPKSTTYEALMEELLDYAERAEHRLSETQKTHYEAFFSDVDTLESSENPVFMAIFKTKNHLYIAEDLKIFFSSLHGSYSQDFGTKIFRFHQDEKRKAAEEKKKEQAAAKNTQLMPTQKPTEAVTPEPTEAATVKPEAAGSLSQMLKNRFEKL